MKLHFLHRHLKCATIQSNTAVWPLRKDWPLSRGPYRKEKVGRCQYVSVPPFYTRTK